MRFSEKLPGHRKISVLLFEAFSNHCLANTIEPFRAANTIAREPLYIWQYFSMDGGTVTSSSGLPVETASWPHARPQGDILFLMPSYGFRDLATPRLSHTLRAARERFQLIVGLDTGAWLMACAGLLDGRQATIHWDEFTLFAETFPDIDVLEDRFVLNSDLATCGGASTAIELMLEMIKQQHSAMFSLEVGALFMHGDKLDLHDPYQRMSSHKLVGSATALMRRTIETPLTIPELASRLKTDQRDLERHFQKEMTMSPLAVYKAIRLREARRLVELTRLSVAEIATRCGYRNASALTRAYRLEFGAPPRTHRSATGP
ncbi:helix-turn-helix domain-containing protein [uncultured Roseibium sp.]|uniref:GlxA family transcriptional regulator n=1 Tax=uncultured Roseibium sp. TaxID=1936171 RepID=UPI002619AD28|nr:helix-turn-helix domain-containing protein [uncultured Roseibium sp.]